MDKKLLKQIEQRYYDHIVANSSPFDVVEDIHVYIHNLPSPRILKLLDEEEGFKYAVSCMSHHGILNLEDVVCLVNRTLESTYYQGVGLYDEGHKTRIYIREKDEIGALVGN